MFDDFKSFSTVHFPPLASALALIALAPPNQLPNSNRNKFHQLVQSRDLKKFAIPACLLQPSITPPSRGVPGFPPKISKHCVLSDKSPGFCQKFHEMDSVTVNGQMQWACQKWTPWAERNRKDFQTVSKLRSCVSTTAQSSAVTAQALHSPWNKP